MKICELSNGVKVLLESDKKIFSVNFSVYFSVGSFSENEKNYGMAHLLEHMLYKGTKIRGYKKIANDFENIGASFNASTTYDMTEYNFKVIKEKLYDGIDILSDLLLNSTFPEKELKKEKKVIFEEMKIALDDPDMVASQNLLKMMFRNNPVGREIIGTKKTLTKITRKDILNFIREKYTTKNMYIVVYGNYDEKTLLKELEKKFVSKKIKKTKGLNDIRTFKIINPEYKPSFKSVKKDVKATQVYLGIPGIGVDDKLYHAQVLYLGILGGGMSSRLFQNIREDKGLCYSIMPGVTSGFDVNVFYINTSISIKNIKVVIKEISKTLEGMNDISKEEFDRVKIQTKSQITFINEMRIAIIMSFVKKYLTKGKKFSIKELLDKIDKVTIDDVKKVAERFSDINNYTFSIVSDKVVKKSDLF